MTAPTRTTEHQDNTAQTPKQFGTNALRFHNVDADPTDDVTTWPYEALVTTIDQGLVDDWQIVFAEIRRSPWGPVACQVERYLAYRDPDGVSKLFTLAIDNARETSERSANLVSASHQRASGS